LTEAADRRKPSASSVLLPPSDGCLEFIACRRSPTPLTVVVVDVAVNWRSSVGR